MEEMDNRSVMQFLIENGADVNAKNYFGFTPLHSAVIHRNRCVIDLLIQAGSDINAKTCLKRTALHFAVSNHQSKKWKRILPSNGEGPDMWMVEKLLDQPDIRVDVKDIRGDTPLMWAVMDKELDAIFALLRSEANPNTRNKDSLTPLHVAMSAQKPCPFVAVALLMHRASINISDKEGNTPIDNLIQNVRNSQCYNFAYNCLETLAFTHRLKKCQKQKLESVPELSAFLNECSIEVLQMKMDYIANGLSVFQFMLLGSEDSNFENSFFEVYVPVVKRLLSWTYPKYLLNILQHIPKTILCIMFEFLNFSKNCKEMLDIDIYDDVSENEDCMNSSDNDRPEDESDSEGCINTSNDDDCENTSDNDSFKEVSGIDSFKEMSDTEIVKDVSGSGGCENSSNEAECENSSNEAECENSSNEAECENSSNEAECENSSNEAECENSSNEAECENNSNEDEGENISDSNEFNIISDNVDCDESYDYYDCNKVPARDSYKDGSKRNCEDISGHNSEDASDDEGCEATPDDRDYKETSDDRDYKETSDDRDYKETSDDRDYEDTSDNPDCEDTSDNSVCEETSDNHESERPLVNDGCVSVSYNVDCKRTSDSSDCEIACDKTDSKDIFDIDSFIVANGIDDPEETSGDKGSEETSNNYSEETLSNGLKKTSGIGMEASDEVDSKGIKCTEVDPRDFFSKIDIFSISRYLSRLDIFCLIVALSKGNIHECMQTIRERDNVK